MLLAYKVKPNDDGKTDYVEFVTVVKNWKDKMFFEMVCKQTDYFCFFIKVSFIEYLKAKINNKRFMTIYENKIKELFRDVKDNGIG